VGVDFLFQGWRGSFAFWGDMEDGSSSIFPWRWSSSTASSDLRPRVLRAQPRSMGVQRRLISFFGTSVDFGSFAKLLCDGALSNLGKMASGCVGSQRQSAAAYACGHGEHRVQGMLVSFSFSKSLCANRLRQLSSVSYCDVPIFLQIFVHFP
jgi:hypothetical protein